MPSSVSNDPTLPESTGQLLNRLKTDLGELEVGLYTLREMAITAQRIVLQLEQLP